MLEIERKENKIDYNNPMIFERLFHICKNDNSIISNKINELEKKIKYLNKKISKQSEIIKKSDNIISEINNNINKLIDENLTMRDKFLERI